MCFFGVVTRFLVIVFGTVVPARCTHNALGNENLTAWAKYWIVYAWLMSLELVGDTFLNWVPLYVEMKLLIVLWLVISAPHASVWVFETILNPLLWRYLPEFDHFLRNDKRQVLGDAIKYTSQVCIRSMDTIVPMVSQIWKRNSSTAPQDAVSEVPKPKVAPPAPWRREVDSHINTVFYDQCIDDDEESPDDALDNSSPRAKLRTHKKLSLPDLAIKTTSKTARRSASSAKRKQLLSDIEEFTVSDDLLLDMEDLLKSERRAMDKPDRPVTTRRESRRRH